MNLTSKDEELIIKFKECLGLENKIGRKARGGEAGDKKYYQVQFGDRNFYIFLLSIGLKPAKSKTLEQLDVPREYFKDFLRGCIDGDGSIGSYRHPESRHPQIRIRLASASRIFLEWVKKEIGSVLEIRGGWIEKKQKNTYALVYAKSDSLKLLTLLYYHNHGYHLERKYIISRSFMGE